MRTTAAQAAVDGVVRAHPDWLERRGDRAQDASRDDAALHVDFLAGAIEAGSTAAFAEYAAWCRRVHRARQVEPDVLTEHLHHVRDVVGQLVPECAALVARVVEAGLDAVHSPPADEERVEGPLSMVRRVFTQAAIRGDRSAAVHVVTAALREGSSPIDIYTGIFEPSQFEVGRLWEANVLSVAEEHLATAVTQHAMSLVFAEYAPLSPSRAGIVIAGVEGEEHQMAANMVADVLAFDGWDVRFLGSNLPGRDIVQEVARIRPSILGISATMLFSTPHVASLASLVRTEMGQTAPKVIVGGAAFRCAPHLAAEVGADGCGLSLTDARALARRLS